MDYISCIIHLDPFMLQLSLELFLATWHQVCLITGQTIVIICNLLNINYLIYMIYEYRELYCYLAYLTYRGRHQVVSDAGLVQMDDVMSPEKN